MSHAPNRDPDPEISAVFAQYPAAARKRVLQLRKLIFTTAARLDGVGAVEECLRWGQPSYLTTASGSGSMLRLQWDASLEQQIGMYVHCQTRLISEFRARYPDFCYQGKRALLIPIAGRLPRAEVADCMGLALTYRQRARKRR